MLVLTLIKRYRLYSSLFDSQNKTGEEEKQVNGVFLN